MVEGEEAEEVLEALLADEGFERSEPGEVDCQDPIGLVPGLKASPAASLLGASGTVLGRRTAVIRRDPTRWE